MPLLIESGMQEDMDEVWLVTADETTRVSRIMRRDGCSAEDALARIRRQMPEEEKRQYANRLLDNSRDEAALFDQVKTLYAALQANHTR